MPQPTDNPNDVWKTAANWREAVRSIEQRLAKMEAASMPVSALPGDVAGPERTVCNGIHSMVKTGEHTDEWVCKDCGWKG